MRGAALIACLAVAGALLAHCGTAPEPDYWDASTEPVGAAPKFVELWSGEPVYDPVGALPSPADATLIVEEPFMTALSRRPLRASTFKLPLADGRFADLSRGRAAKPLRELLRSFDGAIGPGGLLATDASGRFVVHEYGGGLSGYDLVAAEELTLDVARSASAPEWAPSLRGLPPPRSVFRSRGGREVVVVRSGESGEPRFELFVGDERPRGKRYRAVVAFVPASDYRNEPRLDVEFFDAATGAVLARRMNTFLRDSDGERAEWAVHADTARLAIARNGVVRAESLLGESETVEEFGGGNVTAIAAMSAGFVTGHADGTVRLWREKTPTTLAVLPGPVGRVRTFGERVEASVRARSDDERVVSACVVIAGRVETFSVRLESPRGEPLDVGNDRWLVRRTPGGSRAIGARTSHRLPGDAVAAVGDFVVVATDVGTEVYDLSGDAPLRAAALRDGTLRPLSVRAGDGEFIFDLGAGRLRSERPTAGVRFARLDKDEAAQGAPVRPRFRAPPSVPSGATRDFVEAAERRALHFVPANGLLVRFDVPDGLVVFDPQASGPEKRRFRPWRGAAAVDRLLIAPDGDRFVVPNARFDRLLFGDFDRGLAADAACSLVPRTPAGARESDLTDGEVGGRPERGARFAFVANDVVAVCEPDAVRLRHVPTGRDLGRLADPAEALCVSADGATLLLVAGPRVTVLRRR